MSTNTDVAGCPCAAVSGKRFLCGRPEAALCGAHRLDTLIAFGASVAFLFSLFNTFFPDYWLRVGLHPYVYYEVAVLVVAVGLTGKVFRFLPEERHGADRIAGFSFPSWRERRLPCFLSGYSGAV